MNKSTFLPAMLISCVLIITGCGSSPNARFYMLNTLDQNESQSTANTQTQNLAVKVGPVSIPETLDQSQIVSRKNENMLIVDEYNRWGGDIQSDIQRTLGENISILLPTNRVILSQEIALLPVDYQVVVNIRRFDGTLGGEVTLNADWTVVRIENKESAKGKKSVFSEATVGDDYQAYVAAQSRLLARLSEEITKEITRQVADKNRRKN